MADAGPAAAVAAPVAADASLRDLWALFQRYSHEDSNGRFMTPEDFIVSITSDSSVANKLRRMFQVADKVRAERRAPRTSPGGAVPSVMHARRGRAGMARAAEGPGQAGL